MTMVIYFLFFMLLTHTGVVSGGAQDYCVTIDDMRVQVLSTSEQWSYLQRQDMQGLHRCCIQNFQESAWVPLSEIGSVYRQMYTCFLKTLEVDKEQALSESAHTGWLCNVETVCAKAQGFCRMMDTAITPDLRFFIDFVNMAIFYDQCINKVITFQDIMVPSYTLSQDMAAEAQEVSVESGRAALKMFLDNYQNECERVLRFNEIFPLRVQCINLADIAVMDRLCATELNQFLFPLNNVAASSFSSRFVSKTPFLNQIIAGLHNYGRLSQGVTCAITQNFIGLVWTKVEATSDSVQAYKYLATAANMLYVERVFDQRDVETMRGQYCDSMSLYMFNNSINIISTFLPDRHSNQALVCQTLYDWKKTLMFPMQSQVFSPYLPLSSSYCPDANDCGCQCCCTVMCMCVFLVPCFAFADCYNSDC